MSVITDTEDATEVSDDGLLERNKDDTAGCLEKDYVHSLLE